MSDCLLCLHPLGTSPVLSLNKPSVWFCATHQKHLVNGKCPDAKDPQDARIAELEARNRKLKEALRPFARYIAACEADTDKDEAPIKDSDLWVSAFDPVAMSMVELTYGDLFRARAALSTKEDGT